jgi:ribosomal protein L34E
MTLPFAQLIQHRLLGRAAEPRCATCREPLDGLPAIRIHGTVLHRDCLGYRARQALRGHRAV